MVSKKKETLIITLILMRSTGFLDFIFFLTKFGIKNSIGVGRKPKKIQVWECNEAIYPCVKLCKKWQILWPRFFIEKKSDISRNVK